MEQSGTEVEQWRFLTSSVPPRPPIWPNWTEWGDAFRRLFRGAKIVDPERKLPKGWVAVQCHAAEAYQTNPMAEAMKKGTAAERSRAIALVVKRGQ